MAWLRLNPDLNKYIQRINVTEHDFAILGKKMAYRKLLESHFVVNNKLDSIGK